MSDQAPAGHWTRCVVATQPTRVSVHDRQMTPDGRFWSNLAATVTVDGEDVTRDCVALDTEAGWVALRSYDAQGLVRCEPDPPCPYPDEAMTRRIDDHNSYSLKPAGRLLLEYRWGKVEWTLKEAP